VVVSSFGVLGGTPDTYHQAGLMRGTATSSTRLGDKVADSTDAHRGIEMASHTTSNSRSLVGDIADALRMDLLTGSFVAGQTIREREVAERFGVSRTPAREAINRLIAEHLLTQDGSERGAKVVRPTAAALQELYEIRMQLEPMACALAARNASSEHLEHLTRLVDELDELRGPAFVNSHLELHLIIAEAAGRPLLHEMIENLRCRSDPYVRMYLGLGQHGHAQADHHEIVNAIVRRDADAAAALALDHLRHTLDAVQPFLVS
jgi:DNA-binding GntR family transcriptional regulator